MILVSNETLQRVLRTASRDVTRPHLCGVWLERTDEGMTTAVATDGHRQTVVSYLETEIDGCPLSSLRPQAEIAFVPLWMLSAAKDAFWPSADGLFVSDESLMPDEGVRFAPRASRVVTLLAFDKPPEPKEGVVPPKVDRVFRELSTKMEPISSPPWRRVIPSGEPEIRATLNTKSVLAVLSAAKKAETELKRAATTDSEPIVGAGVARFDFAGGKVLLGRTEVGTYGGTKSACVRLQREYAEDAVKSAGGGCGFDLYSTGDVVDDPVLFTDHVGVRVIVMPRRE